MKQYSVDVIADSIIENERITTMKITFPRIVAEELLRHRSFSFCSSSSRAIPIARMIQQNVGFTPKLWRAHQPGMSPIEDYPFQPEEIQHFEAIWNETMQFAIDSAKKFEQLGIAKEISNRLLMPFQWITLLVHGNRKAYENFFLLRCNPNAQYEIRVIAEDMRDAIEHSIPEESLLHLPFVERSMSLVKAIKISAARCARVSYYNHDGKTSNPENDIELANKLKRDMHMSPFEFQVLSKKEFEFMAGGVDEDLSGNLQNTKLLQIRKLIERGMF